MRADLCLVMNQSSHACRAMVYDRLGNCLSIGNVAVKTTFISPKRAEQQPQAILISLKQAALEAISKLTPKQRRHLKTAALISQPSSILCWDADNGKPLTPIINWQDQRGRLYVEKLMPLTGMIRQLTGLYLNAHLPASKLRWCMEHMTADSAKHRIRGGPLSAWLIKQLLQDQPNLIDAVSAARTLLYSLEDKDWHPELLELFQLPSSLLPKICPNFFHYGTLKLPGFDLPLDFVSSNQAAALFAFGEPSQDDLYIHLGHGGFINSPLIERGLHPQERIVHHLIQAAKQPRYSAEASINGAANALEWALNHCRPESQHIDQWADHHSDPPLFMNMISGVGSPYWQSLERSCWVNDAGDPKAQMVAVMESIAFLIYRNIQAMPALPAATKIIIDGQASQLNSLCQRIADLSGLPVQRYDQHDLVTLGAAWQTLPNSIRNIQPDSRFKAEKNSALKQRYQTWLNTFERYLKSLS